MTATPPIPLPQIADQAEALDLRLDEISRELGNSPVPDSLKSQMEEMSQRASQVESFLENGPDTLQLREEILYWRTLSEEFAGQRRQLTARAGELQAQIAMLGSEEARWQATHEEILHMEGIEAVAARVEHELAAIREMRARAQSQLNLVLTLQNELSQAGRRISDSLTKLTDAEATFRISLFDRDGHPLWSSKVPSEGAPPTAVSLRRSSNEELHSSEEFLRSRAIGLLSVPVLFFLFLLAARRLNQYLLTQRAVEPLPAGYEIFTHPWPIALLAVLLLTSPGTQSAPLAIAALIALLWTGLILWLTPFVANLQVRPMVYVLLALNLLDLARAALPLVPGFRRTFLPFILFAALVAYGWLARPSRLRRTGLARWPLLALRIGAWLGLLLLAIALIANIFGFISLSRVLGVSTVLSAFLATVLCYVVLVCNLALRLLLDGPWCRSLSAEIRAGLELWGGRLFVALAALVWVTHSQLYLLVFQDSVSTAVRNGLASPIDLGRINFTLGGVLSVLLILVVGFTLARGASAVVRTTLDARFPLHRGMPYAVSKVAYYCLSVVVLLAAVAAAGVDLNKFTVITGAVGVGVGFGLQNIVNNFASGLILLFERPIRVDDTVEVNGLIGTVKRIGARASTIATAQGAEVIVPNSSLIQNQVINWTLSSPRRRIEIPVGVAYGTDPETVLRLLVGEAAGHANVMTEPAPAAYFIGFGDSALNFELRFWSESQDSWFQLKSEVTVSVARALAAAGIEVPFPQRDLHLRSVAAELAGSSLWTRDPAGSSGKTPE